MIRIKPACRRQGQSSRKKEKVKSKKEKVKFIVTLNLEP